MQNFFCDIRIYNDIIIIPDIAEDGSLEYNDNIVINSDITKEILHNAKFNWPVLGKDYILKYLEYLEKIEFINFDNL